MTRHFIARSSALNFAHAIPGQSARRIFAVSFALILALFSSPVFASTSCDDINADWGAGRTIGLAGIDDTRDDHYESPFDIGEILTYSASTTGTKSTTNFNSVTIWDGTDSTGYEGNDQAAPIEVSNQQYVLQSDSDIYISVGAYNGVDGDVDVFLQVHCAASSPVASSLTTPAVAYGSTSNSIDLSAHATNNPTNYAVGSATTVNGGSVSVDSGGIATYTAPTSFRGDDSFTFTASNSGGTSSPATVTVPVSDPIITVTPATLPGGTSGAIYSQALTPNGGRSPYTFATTPDSGALPAGLSLSSSGVVSGTPTEVGTFSFTVTATDSSTGTGPATFGSAVSLTIAPPYITLNTTSLPGATGLVNYSQSLTASGGIAPYEYYVIAGGLPPGLTLSPAGVISGAPEATGTYPFMAAAYDSSTPAGLPTYIHTYNGSRPYTITVTEDPAVLGDATVSVPGDSSNNPITVSVTGINYGISIATEPVHGAVRVEDATSFSPTPRFIYTPTAGYYGQDSFTYGMVTSLGTSAVPATVTITIVPPAAPVVAPTLVSTPFGTPVAIDLSSFITGTRSSIAIGTSPAHGIATVAGEVVNYAPVTGYAGTDSFTYMATGPGGTSAPATVTLVIGSGAVFSPPPGALLDKAMAKEHYSQSFSALGGANYRVTAGALPPGLAGRLGTDGALDGTLDAGSQGTYHFTITADIGGVPVSASYDLVVLSSAITAPNKQVTIPPGSTPLPVDLTAGATGGPFVGATLGTVTPPQAGTAEITMGDVASIDSVWSHKFYLKFHPNPAYSGSVVIGYTLVSATGSSSAIVTFTASLDPNGVANNFDHLLKDFVQTRASLLANGVDTPGLRQRRGMGAGTSPGTINISPSDSSVTMNFASSLAELQSWGQAGDAAGALAESDPAAEPFNFWIDGTATLHLRSDEGDEHWGRFALVSVGGDYLVNDKLLVGLALHADFMDDIADDTTVEGTGLLIGPYISAEIVDGVFLDASVYYGHSWNDVSTAIFGGDFETERLLAKASLEGEWAMSEVLTLRPKANVFYLHEVTGDYTVTNGAGSSITIAGFSTDQFRLSGGGTLEYRMDLGEGVTITPYFGAQLGLSLTPNSPTTLFTTLTTGFDLMGIGNWTLGGTVEADLESDSLKTISGKARLSAGF